MLRAVLLILLSLNLVVMAKPKSSTMTQSSASNIISKAKGNQVKVAYYKRAETLSQAASYSPNVNKDQKIISGSISTSYSQSLIDQKDGSKTAQQSLMGTLRTRTGDNWGLTTRFSAAQDIQNSESIFNGFGDVFFGLGRKPIRLTNWLNGAPSYSAVLPVSKYSKEVQNLQTSLGASYTFSLFDRFVSPGWSYSLNVGASRNFHQYDTDTAGNVLNQYGMRETISVSYEVRKWTFSADLSMRHGWSYENSISQSYEHSQEVSYTILPTWGVSIGHTNSGAWLHPNGQDSNFELINEDDSILYVSTSVSF
jgi:hypothetical protein